MGLYRSSTPATNLHKALRIGPKGSFDDASGLDQNQDPGKLFVFVFKQLNAPKPVGDGVSSEWARGSFFP